MYLIHTDFKKKNLITCIQVTIHIQVNILNIIYVFKFRRLNIKKKSKCQDGVASSPPLEFGLLFEPMIGCFCLGQ